VRPGLSSGLIMRCSALLLPPSPEGAGFKRRAAEVASDGISDVGRGEGPKNVDKFEYLGLADAMQQAAKLLRVSTATSLLLRETSHSMLGIVITLTITSSDLRRRFAMVNKAH
jgi:hypothetical protein